MESKEYKLWIVRDWYYHTVAMYQCNKCGKVKKKVINWK